jgi:hypothetical protein
MEQIRNKKLKLNFYSSLREMNEADAKAMANISPIDHLQNAALLIKKVYAEALKKPMSKKLKIK